MKGVFIRGGAVIRILTYYCTTIHDVFTHFLRPIVRYNGNEVHIYKVLSIWAIGEVICDGNDHWRLAAFGPKINFYLFAIAYFPLLNFFFFAVPEHFFLIFFLLFECFTFSKKQ